MKSRIKKKKKDLKLQQLEQDFIAYLDNFVILF